jgi:hypothetical protein
MKTEEEVRKRIEAINKDYYHVLHNGGLATIEVNAPRALIQLDAVARLETLHWILGENYIHTYKSGVNQ